MKYLLMFSDIFTILLFIFHQLSVHRRDPWFQHLPWACTVKGGIIQTIGYILVILVFVCLYQKTVEYMSVNNIDETIWQNSTNTTFYRVIANLTEYGDNRTDPASAAIRVDYIPYPMKISAASTNSTSFDTPLDNAGNATESDKLGEEPPQKEMTLLQYFCILFTSLFFLFVFPCVFANYEKGMIDLRKMYQKKYKTALRKTYRVAPDALQFLWKRKLNFSKDRAVTNKVVLAEEFGLHAVTDKYIRNERYFISQEVAVTFEDFMFAPLRRVDGCLFFLDAIVWVYDLMRAVNSMHERGVYHLDLQPNTVGLHWYQYQHRIKWCSKIMQLMKKKNRIRAELMNVCCHNCCDLTKPILVLKRLSRATRCPENRVSSERVGTNDFYKPPECFTRRRVDAGKVDAWGVGIVAFEVLTGGYLAIHGQTSDPPFQRASEIVFHRRGREIMSTAIDSNFRVIDNFLRLRFTCEKNMVLDVDQSVFMTECWSFISCLLQGNPSRRATVEMALECDIMQRVRERNNPFYVNYNL